jgi:hypothetical protein
VQAPLALLPFLLGCSSLLGISDPSASGPKDGANDGAMDGDNGIDAPPPCTTPSGFGAEMSFDVGAVGKALAVGALDGMAGRDVVIAVGTDTIVMHGDNAGTFSNPKGLGSVAGSIVIEDFDGIGFDDLILVNVGGTSVVTRLQTSGGVFAAEAALTGPFANLHDAFAGQLDGNLRADLIVVDDAARTVFTSNFNGTFSKDNVFGAAGDEVVFVGQIDGETVDDAILVSTAGNVKLAADASGAGVQIATGATGRGVGVGNFNDDTLLDLMVASSDGGHVYIQNPAGTFTEQPGAIAGITSTQPLLVADVNGDGTDDIITANRVVLQCPTTRVFTQIENINAKSPVILVDVTNNGKPDLLRLEGTALKVRVE